MLSTEKVRVSARYMSQCCQCITTPRTEALAGIQAQVQDTYFHHPEPDHHMAHNRRTCPLVDSPADRGTQPCTLLEGDTWQEHPGQALDIHQASGQHQGQPPDTLHALEVLPENTLADRAYPAHNPDLDRHNPEPEAISALPRAHAGSALVRAPSMKCHSLHPMTLSSAHRPGAMRCVRLWTLWVGSLFPVVTHRGWASKPR